MAVKKGERRGRYAKKDLAADEKTKTRAQVRAEVRRRADEYLAAARRRLERPPADGEKARPEPDWTGAESAALQLAALEVHLEEQTTQAVRGLGSAEEVARLPGLSRELRHLRAELGIALYGPDGEPPAEAEEPL